MAEKFSTFSFQCCCPTHTHTYVCVTVIHLSVRLCIVIISPIDICTHRMKIGYYKAFPKKKKIIIVNLLNWTCMHPNPLLHNDFRGILSKNSTSWIDFLSCYVCSLAFDSFHVNHFAVIAYVSRGVDFNESITFAYVCTVYLIEYVNIRLSWNIFLLNNIPLLYKILFL